MRKKFTTLLLIFAIILPLLSPVKIIASPTSEMNIYAIYLDSPERGDSVLLESKGHALLIDIGRPSHIPSIIKQLRALNLTHVDICFSHLHADHTGSSSTDTFAGLRMLMNAGITIDNLYLPSQSIAPYSSRFLSKLTQIENFMFAYSNLHYLNVGDTITVGDATGSVIGPVNTSTYSPYQYIGSNGSITSSMYTLYENNCSLSMIFTCGNTKYFTAGDCFEDQAKALCERYGSALKCDIMKLCHHGTPSGNTAALINNIQPSYSFASNTAYTEKNSSSGYWATYAGATRATKYGMFYAIGNEKKTLIYHIVNDQITLYKGLRITAENKLTGWQHFFGSDGINMDYNTYYLDQNGLPVTGTHLIGKHYFSFDSTGLMQYGSFNKNNNSYDGWVTTPEGIRYYTLTSDRKYSYLSVGFQTIDHTLYYFSQKGYLLTNTETDAYADPLITKIGSSYYAVDQTGALASDEWIEQDGFEYFFGKNGKMYRNCKTKMGGIYYLFDTDGTLLAADSGYELVNLKNNWYAVNSDGEVATKKCLKISGEKYYFNAYGNMVKKTAVKIGKSSYYFSSNGTMVNNKTIKWNGQKYKCLSNGVMKKL